MVDKSLIDLSWDDFDEQRDPRPAGNQFDAVVDRHDRGVEQRARGLVAHHPARGGELQAQAGEDLAEIVDLGLVYNGTTAVEMGLLEIPCLLAGHFAPIDYPIGHPVAETVTILYGTPAGRAQPV